MRILEAGLGPGGRRAALAIALLAIVRGAALVLVAEGVARGVVAVQAGGDPRQAALLVATGALLRALAAWATSVVAARGASAARAEARTRLARRLVDPRRAEVEAGEAAQLAANGLDALDDYFGAVLPAMAAAVVLPVGLGAWVLSRDWVSALVLALTLPLVPLFMALIGMHTSDRVEAAQAALARLADRMVELARGLPVLVGLGRDAEQGAALAAVQAESRRRTRQTLRTAFLSALALELVATISVAVIAVLLGIRLLNGSVELAPALVALVLAPEVFGALREVGTAFHASQDGLAALRRVAALTAPVETVPLPIALGPDGIRVDRLTVRHPGRAVPALDAVSAEFPAGELTVLAGPSGSGKSTLLAAVATALADRAPGAAGYAPQAPAFVLETVREELALAGDRGEGILARLGLAALVDAPPAQLSPGEARRLAVAAALLRAERGASVVLLDEPTAHLDEESAHVVRELVGKLRGRATIVVATHDASLIRLADSIVALPARIAAGRPADGTGPAPRPAAPAGVAASAVAATPATMRPPRARWGLAIALGVLAAGFALALSAVSGWLIVRASEGPAIMYLLVAIVGVRFFGLGRSVVRYAERLVTHDATLAAVDGLRSRMWAALASRGAAARRVLAGGSTADLLIARLGQLQEELPRVRVPLISGALVLVGVVVTAALVAPLSAALVAVGLVVATAAGLALALAAGRAGVERGGLRARLARRVAGLAEAGPALAMGGSAERALALLDGDEARLATLDRRIAALGGAATAAGTAGVLGTAALMLGTAGAGIAAPQLAAVVLLVIAALDPMLALLAAARRAPALRAARAAIRPALSPAPPVPSGDREVGEARSLAIEELAARWPDADLPVFAGADARAEAGEWLVVSGPSGSGKSTLLTVLLGRLAPASGRVALDGVASREADPARWRAAVGWCPQEAHVFDSTVRGNLLLGRPRGAAPSEEEMADVLREVGLGPLLAELEDGLDARVGSGGRALSGGERQRLAVARTLLGGARVLLLDEPTAHLDEEGAADLLADLRRAARDRVVVLVTHRPEDAAPGDRELRLGAVRPVSAAARP